VRTSTKHWKPPAARRTICVGAVGGLRFPRRAAGMPACEWLPGRCAHGQRGWRWPIAAGASPPMCWVRPAQARLHACGTNRWRVGAPLRLRGCGCGQLAAVPSTEVILLPASPVREPVAWGAAEVPAVPEAGPPALLLAGSGLRLYACRRRPWPPGGCGEGAALSRPSPGQARRCWVSSPPRKRWPVGVRSASWCPRSSCRSSGRSCCAGIWATRCAWDASGGPPGPPRRLRRAGLHRQFGARRPGGAFRGGRAADRR